MKKINSEILSLALPSILANITVPLVGMVDIAVAGNLDSDSAPLIGGIAIGSMLFDLLYWNFAFLRVSTGGLTAQAYGKADFAEAIKRLAENPQNLENLESYLSWHFPEWLERYANTPENMAAEMLSFANMEI